MNAKPLYTTITTEYLEELMSAKYILDNITRGTVRESHLRMVCDSLLKAKTKHPIFADMMFDESIDMEAIKSLLDNTRHDNDVNEMSHQSNAYDIMQEEILEAMEQFLNGNHEECGKELADTACVIFRMMEMNDAEAKK